MLYTEIKDKLIDSLSIRERLVNITDDTDVRQGNIIGVTLSEEMYEVIDGNTSFYAKEWMAVNDDGTLSSTGYYAQVYYVLYYVLEELYAIQYYAKGQEIQLPDTPQNQYYTFKYWQNLPKNVNGYIKATAVLEQTHFRLQYFLDGKLKSTYWLKEDETLPDFTSDNQEAGTEIKIISEKPSTMPAKNLNVYAVNMSTLFTVFFYVDDALYTTQSYGYGQSISPPIPKKDNYVFVEWTNLTKTMPANDLTVNAVFTEKDGSGSGTPSGPGSPSTDLYRLIWKLDGASLVTQYLKEGDVLTVPSEMYKTGYTTKFRDPSSSATYDNFTDIYPSTMPAEYLQIYCVTTPNKYYTLYYKIEDETVNSVNKYPGEAITPFKPIMSNYPNWNGTWLNEPEIMPARDTVVSGGTFITRQVEIEFFVDDKFTTENMQHCWHPLELPTGNAPSGFPYSEVTWSNIPFDGLVPDVNTRIYGYRKSSASS